MADLWRNVTAQGLVSHVAIRAEAATTLEAMERELQCLVARRQLMESQMPAWQNSEHHAWQDLRHKAEEANTLAAKLQRVTQKVADEERYAPPRDPAKIARYHSALAGYSDDLAEAVAKMQTLVSRSPAMTLNVTELFNNDGTCSNGDQSSASWTQNNCNGLSLDSWDHDNVVRVTHAFQSFMGFCRILFVERTKIGTLARIHKPQVTGEMPQEPTPDAT